jgi:hypothetical protein
MLEQGFDQAAILDLVTDYKDQEDYPVLANIGASRF